MKNVIEFWDSRHKDLSYFQSGGDKGLSIGENYEFYIYRLERILYFLRKNFLYKRPLAILDAGCGKGFFTKHLIKCEHFVYSIDSSKEAIEYVIQNINKFSTKTLLHEFETTQLFDSIICIDVLFHIVDYELWQLTIKKFCTSVKIDGLIILTDTLPKNEQSLSDYIVYRSYRDYEREFAKYGFTISEIEAYEFGANSNKFVIFKKIN